MGTGGLDGRHQHLDGRAGSSTYFCPSEKEQTWRSDSTTLLDEQAQKRRAVISHPASHQGKIKSQDKPFFLYLVLISHTEGLVRNTKKLTGKLSSPRSHFRGKNRLREISNIRISIEDSDGAWCTEKKKWKRIIWPKWVQWRALLRGKEHLPGGRVPSSLMAKSIEEGPQSGVDQWNWSQCHLEAAGLRCMKQWMVWAFFHSCLGLRVSRELIYLPNAAGIGVRLPERMAYFSRSLPARYRYLQCSRTVVTRPLICPRKMLGLPSPSLTGRGNIQTSRTSLFPEPKTYHRTIRSRKWSGRAAQLIGSSCPREYRASATNELERWMIRDTIICHYPRTLYKTASDRWDIANKTINQTSKLTLESRKKLLSGNHDPTQFFFPDINTFISQVTPEKTKRYPHTCRWRWLWMLQCWCREYSTPRLDALASSGTRFNNCHSTLLCTPSRWIHCQESPMCSTTSISVSPNSEPPSVLTFETSGYATAVAGKGKALTKRHYSPRGRV